MPTRARVAGALLIVSTWLCVSCTSRTTPLPPPEVMSVSKPDADGFVSVTGFALEGASIGVVNDSTLEGVITTNDEPGCQHTCMFRARLAAKSGDGLRVWQFFEVESGQDAHVP
jgi:hypothetical protein